MYIYYELWTILLIIDFYNNLQLWILVNVPLRYSPIPEASLKPLNFDENFVLKM